MACDDRLGLAIAQPPLIQILTNTKAPYNVASPTARLALQALSPAGLALMEQNVSTLTSSRASLITSLTSLAPILGLGSILGGNDANFIVLPILDKPGVGAKPDNVRASRIYKRMAEESGVVVRFRGYEHGCEGCLRITVGTEEENRVMLEKLEESLRLTMN